MLKRKILYKIIAMMMVVAMLVTMVPDFGIQMAYAADECTVAFDSKGGSEVNPQTVNMDTTVTEPSLPTKEGYIFGGWYTDATLNSAFNFNTPINANITLHARWNAVFADFFSNDTANWAPVSGTWSLNEGTYYQSSILANQDFSLAGDTNWTDYTVEADMKIISGGGDDTGIAFRVTDENNLYMLAVRKGEEIELYKRTEGSWYPLKISTTPSIANDEWYHYKIVLEGTNIKVYFNNSPNPSIDINDSTFTSGKIGLRTNGTPARFDNVVVHTAKCMVSFNSNDGSAVAPQTVLSGNTATEPSLPTKEGYIFGGWYTDATLNSAFNFNTPIAKNTALYAKWSVDESPKWASGYPKKVTVGSTTAQIATKTNKPGKAYYVVLSDGASGPSAAEVKAGTGKGGISAIKKGSITLAADTEALIDLTGLSSTTVYNVYLVAEDDKETPNLQQTTEKVIIATDIIAYYKFEGNALDSSGNGKDGTAGTGVSYVSGFSGQAANFDGAENGNIVLPYGLIHENPNFTLIMRFKTTNSGGLLGYQNAEIGGTPDAFVPILSVRNDGKLYAELWIGKKGGKQMSIVSTQTVNDGNWHKVALSATTTTLALYIDDVLVESKSTSDTLNYFDMSYNQLGTNDSATRDNQPDGWNPYTGLMDDCYIISKGMSNNDIQRLTSSLALGSTEIPEASDNDGSITAKQVVTLNNATFVEDLNGGVTVNNLPAGMGISVTRNSDTQMTIAFTGNATNHESSDSIDNASVTIAQSKIVGASSDVSSGTFSFIFSNAESQPAPNLTASTGTTDFTKGSAVVVDNALTITSTDNIEGAKVYITNGFEAGDMLSFENQNGITGSYDKTKGILTLSGTATAAHYQTALRSVTFNNMSSKLVTGTRTIGFSIGTAVGYKDHYYEFVAAPGMTWNDAKTAAEQRTLYGLQGYLATITSQVENDFVAKKTTGNGWLGLTDEGHDREWYWVTGPEAGTKIADQWDQPLKNGGYDPVSNTYNNWASGEPNNYPSNTDNGENCGHMYAGKGTWNDYKWNNSSIRGYIVEYGGMPSDPTINLYDEKELSVSLSNDALLSNLTTNNGAISPVYDISNLKGRYELNVAHNVSSLVITATTSDSSASLHYDSSTGYNEAGTSGNASGNISLNVGSNTIHIVVTAQDNVTTKTYTLMVYRAASEDANLTGLVSSVGTLLPTFDSGITSYTLDLGDQGETTLTPTTSDVGAVVSVDGKRVESGHASGSITVNPGETRNVPLVVTAQDGTTTKIYSVAVKRNASSDNTLSALTLKIASLNETFAPNIYSYTASVENDVTSIQVIPTLSDLHGTVAVNGTVMASGRTSGEIDLNVGDNTIMVRTTAQNGVQQEYTIVVNRSDSPIDTENVQIIYTPGDDASHVTGTVTLPSSGEDGSTITWESDDNTVINTMGQVVRPDYFTGDRVITLTATINKNSESQTKTFKLNVCKTIYVAPTVTLGSAMINESANNDGSIEGTQVVTITGGSFVEDISAADVTANNLPAGLCITLTRDNAQQLTIGFTGKTADHRLDCSVENVSFTIAKDKVNGTLSDLTTETFGINYYDPARIYLGEAEVMEPGPNYDTGTIAGSLTVYIENGSFSNDISIDDIQLNGLPNDLDFALESVASNQLVLNFTGAALLHDNENDVPDATVTVYQDHVMGTDNPMTSNTFKINFNEPEPIMQVDVSVIRESKANDGSLEGAVTATLIHGIFAQDISDADVTVTGLPKGVELSNFTRESNTKIHFEFSGNALSHEEEDSLEEACVQVFAEKVIPDNLIFENNVFPIISNSFTIRFISPPPYITAQKDLITESLAQDGSITDQQTIILTDGVFLEVTKEDVRINNLPEGLDYQVTKVDNTTLTIAFTGHAAVMNKASRLASISIAASKISGAKNNLTTQSFTIDCPSYNTLIAHGLSGLTLTVGEQSVSLAPTFDAETLSYSADVDTAVSVVVVTPIKADTNSVVTINGIPYAGPGGQSISLKYGLNTLQINVQASDGTTKTYNLSVYRQSSGSNHHTNAHNTKATADEKGAAIIVNGQVHENSAVAMTVEKDNVITTTMVIDPKKLEQKLEAEGQGSVVTVPVNTKADVVIGELTGQMVKNMEAKEAVLEIKKDTVTYKLPASEINIDAVSDQIGQQVALQDIKVHVAISAASPKTVQIIEDMAGRDNYNIVVKPVDFEITCTNGDKTVEVSKFNGYVERTVAIPDGINPSKITTGIVFNADGTFSHVPTRITVVDGKYYAKINSLTNSVYSIIYSPKNFADVEKHWAKDAVNDMGSRLVISGVGDDRFEPDRDITRAEFAAIVVRALGLMRTGVGKDSFGDVSKNEWYYDAVSIAYEYGIISGYGNGKFIPEDNITREQAMTIIARAMKLTGPESGLMDAEISSLLVGFADSTDAAGYAKASIATCIETGIVSGRGGKQLAPKDNITRAEVASIVQKLLKKAELI
ncbi:cadherin-like beta sandwich domain-containing protein [Anaerovorax odorimutans]|uniref:cadherin-like beta sandwich domain-containing protein n=1 Tax=Anaerovorax odorimutans TaxID=109327 RepID=UPI000422EBA6|nr:cadherin-like beta sandwich domain-containing protein [Anaerovorax odorimutans]